MRKVVATYNLSPQQETQLAIFQQMLRLSPNLRSTVAQVYEKRKAELANISKYNQNIQEIYEKLNDNNRLKLKNQRATLYTEMITTLNNYNLKKENQEKLDTLNKALKDQSAKPGVSQEKLDQYRSQILNLKTQMEWRMQFNIHGTINQRRLELELSYYQRLHKAANMFLNLQNINNNSEATASNTARSFGSEPYQR